MHVALEHGFQPKVFAQLMTAIFSSLNAKIITPIFYSVIRFDVTSLQAGLLKIADQSCFNSIWGAAWVAT